MSTTKQAKESLSYHKSFSLELKSQKNRVRQLVSHSAEDGAYKEVIFRESIRNFIPERYNVATGFVIKPVDRGKHLHTSQQDVIIYDTDYPVAFKKGEFVIVTNDAVRALIEVKSNFSKISRKERIEVLKKCNDNGKLIWDYFYSNDIPHVPPFFNGLFSFESNWRNKTRDEFFDEYAATLKALMIEDVRYKFWSLNHVAFNDKEFIKFWPDFTLKQRVDDLENSNLSLYEIPSLSFTFFISNLLDVLSQNKSTGYAATGRENASILLNNKFWFPTDKSSLAVRSEEIWVQDY